MTASLSDLKVLIVDDNKFMINLVKRILDKLDITSPLEANDGASALERAGKAGDWPTIERDAPKLSGGMSEVAEFIDGQS